MRVSERGSTSGWELNEQIYYVFRPGDGGGGGTGGGTGQLDPGTLATLKPDCACQEGEVQPET